MHVALISRPIVDEMRDYLESAFRTGNQTFEPLTPDVIARFLLANKIARDSGNREFEQTKLMIGKACDESCKENGRNEMYSGFFKLIELVHLYEDTQEQINRLAFIDSMSVDAELIIALHNSMLVFDALDNMLFERLFLTELFASNFIGSYGRRRVRLIADGLRELSAGTTTVLTLIDNLNQLEKEQKLLMILLDNIRANIRNNYSRFASKNDLDALKRLITIELRHKNLLFDDIPDELFSKGIGIIKKEAIYYNNILPLILQSNQRQLREEFISESGLDLFYIEEIEYDYCDSNNIPRERLARLR